MCGIWCILNKDPKNTEESTSEYAKYVEKLSARGPERLTTHEGTSYYMGFTRLAINGLTVAGDQPIIHTFSSYNSKLDSLKKHNIIAICNGELYNYKEIADKLRVPLKEGSSDCYILPHLLGKLSPTVACRAIDGVFAFIVVNEEEGWLLVARDPYGVRPLFQAEYENGSHVWSSELKALPPNYKSVAPFPPGTWRKYSVVDGCLLDEYKYHVVPWIKNLVSGKEEHMKNLRESLEAAVEKRLLSERPVGALLSGGLDSSLIASIAAKKLASRGQKLHTFSIGMPGSTDLAYARKVAEHIGSIHHEIVHSKEDFINAIKDVIYSIESYDITTVRASVGNWLIGKWIATNTDIKVVLNGDGSDEVGGGYLYFYNAPSGYEFEEECDRLLDDIHLYDVLRSDRSISSHGLEPRTPFLDRQFVAAWKAIPTEMRRPVKGQQVEKWILREAFASTDYLPEDVLWRKKEAFSDGVSSTEDSWYVTAAKWAEENEIAALLSTTYDVQVHRKVFMYNPPRTAEARFYRKIFDDFFDENAAACIPYMWLPKWVPGSSTGNVDPSARTLGHLY
jgi:asparagine synthase (glutamine-hydrolysing)